MLLRLGTQGNAAPVVVAIEKAVDPGELSSAETKAIARNHVGEIDISLAQPLAADPYVDNPRTGRLVIEVNGRIAGGGLVLGVDAGQRAVPVDIVPVESALRPDERSARYRHNGAVVWLTGLPGSGKSTLARALERRLFSAAARRSCSTATRCAPDSTATSVSRRRIAPKTSAGSPKSRRISRATVTSRSSLRYRRRAEDRAAARRIADNAFREIYVATPAEVCESRDPKGHYAKARAGVLHGFTGIGNDYQAPEAVRTDDRYLDSHGKRCHRRDRADASGTGILFDELTDVAANI